MLIIPAIDLQDGCVVRFAQGKTDKKIYSRDALKVARHWVKGGAKLIHIIDLDGAFSGKQKNIGIIKSIAASLNVPLQVGGGVRSMEAIKGLLDAGVSRVILGTKAVEDKAFLKKAFKAFKDKLIVSIDTKAGEVLTKGWKSTDKKADAITFACELKKLGFKEIIYTDTLKDGMLSGPNIKAIKDLIKGCGLEVIASGGISCLEDIYKLKKLELSGVNGVIIGKALYEGKFTLPQAMKFG